MSDNILGTGLLPEETEVRQMSPVTLAFIGDAVFGLLVREHLIASGITKAGALHKQAVGYVKAGAQAVAAEHIQELLTPDEHDMFRRGRNANTTHVPKNANPADYRHATGLEALFGYLYLCGRQARVRQLFGEVTQFLEHMGSDTSR